MRLSVILVLCPALLAAWLSAARAQWGPSGVPVCICPLGQSLPTAVSDGGGGTFVVWRDFRNGSLDLYAQFISPSGVVVPGWPQDGLPIAVAPSDQDNHEAVSDGLGGLLLAWQDYRDVFSTGSDIYALRVLSDGTLAPGWPPNGLAICRAPEDQTDPELVSDGAGGALIAWTDWRNGNSSTLSNPDVYAVRVTSDANVAEGWTAGGTAVAAGAAVEVGPLLVGDGAGGAIIVWRVGAQANDNEVDIYAQRLTATGSVANGWPLGGVRLCGAREAQVHEAICSDGASGAFVAWHDYRSYPGPGVGPRFPWLDIYAQRVTADGEIPEGWPADGMSLCSFGHGQNYVGLAADGQGGAIASWSDYRTSQAEVFAVRFRGNGTLAPGWPVDGRRVANTRGAEFKPTIIEDGSGGAYIAFENWGQVISLYAQHVTGAGAVATGWPQSGLPVAEGSGQFDPGLARSGPDAVVVWSGEVGADIYAQKLFFNGGAVPTQVSLASVDAQPDQVTIRWYSAGGLSGLVRVERRTETEAWRLMGPADAAGKDYLEYRDREVVPGTRYAYRLVYSTSDHEETTPEVWIDVPRQLEFNLEGFRPNPSRASPVVWFTLPTPEPATLELLDASGRRIAEYACPLSPGRHGLRLTGHGVPTGVYWVRLRQGERTLARRGVVFE